MPKPLKILLIVVAALVALCALALLLLVLLVDPNDFKPQLVSTAKAQSGRELRIDGELGWSFYPVLGIEVGRAELANAPGFGTEPMLAVERIAVGVDLLPLLSRRINVSQLRLERPRLNLGRDARGRSNWDDILEHRERLAAAAPSNASQQPQSGAEPAPEVSISAIELIDASFSWRDAQAQQQFVIAPVDLAAGPIRLGEAVPLTLSLAVASEQPALQANLELSARVATGTDFQKLTITDLTLRTEASGEALPARELTAELAGRGAVDLAAQRLQFGDGVLTFELPGLGGGLDAKGELRFDLQGDLAQRRFQSERLTLETRLAGGSLPGGGQQLTLTTPLSIDLGAGDGRLQLSGLHLAFDNSNLRGRLGSTLGETKQVDFALELDRIDADRYLPAEPDEKQKNDKQEKNKGAPATGPGPAVPTTAPAPAGDADDTFAFLDKLALNGQLKIGELHIQNLDLRDVVMTVRSSGRTLTLDPLSAALYGGRATVKVAVDARGAEPQTRVQTRAEQIALGALLDAWLQKRGPVEGSGNLVADLNFSGLDTAAILGSLGGGGELRLADGAVRGVNVAQEIRNALAAVKRQPRQQQALNTDFTELVVPFELSGGNFSWSELSASSPLLRVGSQGAFNLLGGGVDTQLDVTVVQSLKGQGGEPLGEVAGLRVPVKIKGNLDDPKVSVDLVKVLEQTKLGARKEELEAKLKEKSKLSEDELKEKANKELQRGLDRLFKKSD